MELANIFLMCICICIASGSELRNLSKGLKTFYDLAENNLETEDLFEIMTYLEQRFHRKCFSVEHGNPMDIRRKDAIDILGNFEAELTKLSSDIADDRTRFQTLIMINHVSKTKFLKYKRMSKSFHRRSSLIRKEYLILRDALKFSKMKPRTATPNQRRNSCAQAYFVKHKNT